MDLCASSHSVANSVRIAGRSNPTNIIIGEAVDLSFLAFSKWSLLPTVFTGAATYGVLVAAFRRRIADAPALEEDVEPTSLLHDWCAHRLLFLCTARSVVGNCFVSRLACAARWRKHDVERAWHLGVCVLLPRGEGLGVRLRAGGAPSLGALCCWRAW